MACKISVVCKNREVLIEALGKIVAELKRENHLFLSPHLDCVSLERIFTVLESNQLHHLAFEGEIPKKTLPVIDGYMWWENSIDTLYIDGV